VAFTVLKLVGAGYLLYLAWQIFRASVAKINTKSTTKLSFGKLYARGIIMNVTNPKVSIFFLAFLPQFADPKRGSLTLQLMMLGGIFIISTLLVFGSIAILAGLIGEWLNRSEKTQKIINWVAGFIFVGIAIKLITAER
jgi:threonine/homoserine/homoserine lactone efflux protein